MEVHTFPRTVDDIYDDYCHRRYGLQRALTDGAPGLGGAWWAIGLASGTIAVGAAPARLATMEPAAVQLASAAPRLLAAALHHSCGCGSLATHCSTFLSTAFAPQTDVEQLYEKCDPERENLCLYGEPGAHLPTGVNRKGLRSRRLTSPLARALRRGLPRPHPANGLAGQRHPYHVSAAHVCTRPS